MYFVVRQFVRQPGVAVVYAKLSQKEQFVIRWLRIDEG